MSKNNKVKKEKAEVKPKTRKKMGTETRKILLEAKHEKKTIKKTSKVTQMMKIEDTVDPEHRSHQTKLWAEKQIARLSKKQKSNRKKYAIVSAVLSLFNLSVVILACVALQELIFASHHATPEELVKIDAQIALASAAASITIVIFVLNIGTIIYRGFMRWFIYKDALDAIQVEVMKHQNKRAEYQDVEDIDKLLEERVHHISHAALTNRSHKKWRSMLMKALAGGDYE